MIYTSFDELSLVKVLLFLKSHYPEFLSGQDLSDVLKISRVAIWKHIKKIRSLGYKIESKQKLGYRLVNTTKLLLPWEIIDGLKTKTIGKRVYYFDSIDSTQDFAIKIASQAIENGTVIVSQKQTKGRGRLGRKWISPKGGIWLSIILRPIFDISMTTLFPIASSLALANAIEENIGIKPELKWPNDITIKGKKVAGTLIDVTVESNKIENIVLGVGINYQIDSSKLEKSLKNSENFYGATTLIRKNNNENPITFVKTFLYELEQVFNLLNNEQPETVIKNWIRRSSTIGRNIEILTHDGKVRGKAVKLDMDGALIIKNKTGFQRILVGDLVYTKK